MTTIHHLGKRTRPARIPHECDCCGHPIQPGQVYTRVFFLENRKARIMKYHEPRPAGEDECIWRKVKR